MLRTLLVLLNSVAFISGAIVWAKVRGESGLLVFTLASLLGIVMAFGNGWLWHRIGKAVVVRISEYSEFIRERYLAILYIAAVVWIPIAAALGYWITKSIALLL